MDRLIYTAMTGAKQVMEQQAATANNLANVGTSGFRAQINAFRAVPVQSGALPTRAYVVDSTVGADFRPAAVQETGRPLDVAVQGAGWLAVQTADGGEAYTRGGGLRTSETGLLITQAGHPVLGDAGPITIPAETAVHIAADGTVSTVPTSGSAADVAVLGRLKLVNPPEQDLRRGADGLFRTATGIPADVDAGVMLAPGALEGSNVNVVEAMVGMITLSRQFDMNMKLIQTAEANDGKAAQIISA